MDLNVCLPRRAGLKSVEPLLIELSSILQAYASTRVWVSSVSTICGLFRYARALKSLRSRARDSQKNVRAFRVRHQSAGVRPSSRHLIERRVAHRLLIPDHGIRNSRSGNIYGIGATSRLNDGAVRTFDSVSVKQCARAEKAVIPDGWPTFGFGHVPEMGKLHAKEFGCQVAASPSDDFVGGQTDRG